MASPIGGIGSAFTSAVSGLRSATDRFGAAAASIATQGAALTSQPDTAQFSPQASALAAASGQGNASLEGSLVDEKMAQHQFVANLRVIRAADEQLDALIHMGARRS